MVVANIASMQLLPIITLARMTALGWLVVVMSVVVVIHLHSTAVPIVALIIITQQQMLKMGVVLTLGARI
jgi:hypothetical protein